MDEEAEFLGFHEAGRFAEAATVAVERYGPEVLGFLVTYMRDHAVASDVFGQTCEDLWTGLARFERRASVRTWFYTLARHAAARHRRTPHARRERHLGVSAADDLAERVRSHTLPHLLTASKDKLREIRDALDPDDRALLVLRIDRELPWNDIAAILEGEADPTRASARLRKRFEVLKAEIRERAEAAGLLTEK